MVREEQQALAIPRNGDGERDVASKLGVDPSEALLACSRQIDSDAQDDSPCCADMPFERDALKFHSNNPGGGRLYGPTAAGTLYFSSPAHRAKGRRHKSRWSCTESEESDCFEASETNIWLDASQNWWWVGANGTPVVGEKGEKLAFFPARSNVTDPTHGYPVSLLQDQDYVIPDALVDRWKSCKHIDGITAKRIKGRKI